MVVWIDSKKDTAIRVKSHADLRGGSEPVVAHKCHRFARGEASSYDHWLMATSCVMVTRRFPTLRFVVTTTLPADMVVRVLENAIDEPSPMISLFPSGTERIRGRMQANRFSGRLPGSLVVSNAIPAIAGEVISRPHGTDVNVRATMWPAFVPAAFGVATMVMCGFLAEKSEMWECLTASSTAVTASIALYCLEVRRVRLFFSALLLPPTSPYA